MTSFRENNGDCFKDTVIFFLLPIKENAFLPLPVSGL